LTSADSKRLWWVTDPVADRISAEVRPPSSSVPSTAKTEAMVTPPFERLEEHVGNIYRYALRLAGRADLADDLTQETILRACRSWRSLRDPQAARVWLLRIATNLWTDYLRRARFRPRVLAAEPECPLRSVGNASDERETVAAALAAMDELPPRQRRVLYLVTCEELTHAEVADVLGIGVGAVKANLSLARKEMRRRLREVYSELYGECEEKN
jgi:RNA polymerase sigma-70 factor, ECF subfamily